MHGGRIALISVDDMGTVEISEELLDDLLNAAGFVEVSPSSGQSDLAEWGRVLASKREDLIAAGVDPAELVIPLHPEPSDSGATS